MTAVILSKETHSQAGSVKIESIARKYQALAPYESKTTLLRIPFV